MGEGNMTEETLLEARDLQKYYYSGLNPFSRKKRVLRAVDGVSLSIDRGQVVGLVGESGCGKSTLGRAILHLDTLTGGHLSFDGEDITQHTPSQMRPIRKKMQMIFQDPFAALNPRMTTFASTEAPLIAFGESNKASRREAVREILRTVGLSAEYEHKYPHEMSGGQRQRVVIARAMILEPELVICDEPVSALDVSVRAQVLNLIKDLGEQKNLSYLFISHDLGVVHYLCHSVYVMYLGKIVESAEKKDLFSHPLHPYTEALLSAVLAPDPRKKRSRLILQGDLPSPFSEFSGCRFFSRCPYASAHCEENEPPLQEVRPGHQAACWLHS
jgi:peptide/nickel transport system ATP-binding protein/oligopeptide transport system ATP-binding protein